ESAMARTASSRTFTPAYVLYLAAIVAATVVAFRYTHPRVETLEDMERPDYRNVEGRIDRPRLLHELAAGASVTHDGVEYRTNSDGMRDDREYSVEKPPGYRRLVFLGDSFTFGSGVVLELPAVVDLGDDAVSARSLRSPEVVPSWTGQGTAPESGRRDDGDEGVPAVDGEAEGGASPSADPR